MLSTLLGIGARCACVAGVWAIVGGTALFATTTQKHKVHPAHLSLDAMLNEPLVFQIEINSEDTLGKVDLVATGLRIQREIKSPARNRRVFLIEPDTSVVGRVNGSIAIVEMDGTTLCTVPVSGEVKPYVRISPTRLFLGSLEYGTTSENIIEKRFRLSSAEIWKVANVDVSEITDAKCEVIDVDPWTKELQLRFAENALKAGEPFGAFVNRAVRIQTNLAAQPEISVPVTAMLSKNGTERNFNTFMFKGNERWQGRWGTPNIAAAVVGPLVLLALGYGAWFLRTDSRYHLLIWSIGALLCIGALAGMLFLVKTYSRGGWVAFGLGIASLILLMKGSRCILALGAVTILIMMAAMPAGAQRALSAAELTEDGSIRNRLLVWRGTLEMIADNPIRGVGADRFGEVFQNYYQEPWHNASYSTAINDYLTFAAERGLIVVLLTVSAGVLLAAVSVQFIRRHSDYWAAPVVCVFATLAASSVFSSILFVRDVRILALGSAAILIAYCVVRILRTRRAQATERYTVIRGILTRSVAALVSACIAGGTVVWAEVTRSVGHTVGASGVGSTIEYSPGTISPRGTILFLPEQSGPPTVIGRKVLRPLAQNGWRAIAMELPPYDQEATLAITNLIRDIPAPVFILAEQRGARVAIGAAQVPPQGHRLHLAFIEPIFFSALPECDKSHALGTHAQRLVRVDMKDWETFKQDSRTGGRGLFETLCVLANAPERTSSDEPGVASDSLKSDPELLRTVAK